MPSVIPVLPELSALTARLKDPRLPTQMVIAKVAGVPQSLVSQAACGKLSRMTARVRRLIEYTDNCLGAATSVPQDESRHNAIQPAVGRKAAKDVASQPFASRAEDMLRQYLEEGYDAEAAVDQIELLRRVQRERRPGRQIANTRS